MRCVQGILVAVACAGGMSGCGSKDPAGQPDGSATTDPESGDLLPVDSGLHEPSPDAGSLDVDTTDACYPLSGYLIDEDRLCVDWSTAVFMGCCTLPCTVSPLEACFLNDETGIRVYRTSILSRAPPA